jgi:hypothetical protein
MAETISAEEFQRRYGSASQPSGETISAEEFAARYGQSSVADTSKKRLAGIKAGADLPPGMTPDQLEGGFWQGVSNTLPSWDGVKQVGKVAGVAGPIEQGKAFLDVVKNAASAANDQRKKALASLGRGDLVEGGGHALAAAIPVLGPAAAQAGEKIADGEIAEGLGEGAGLVAGVFAPRAAGQAAGKVARPVADALDRSAVSQYTKALGGNKYQKATRDVAQELINRRVKTTNPRENLASFAESKAAAIDTDALAAQQAPLDVNAALQRIEDAKASLYRDNGGVQVPKDINSDSIAKALDEYADILRQNADAAGTIPMDAAIDLRRTWGDKAGKAGAWLKDETNFGTGMQARVDATDSLAGAINENPAIAAANKEKSFWLKTKDIAKAAPENKPLLTPFDATAVIGGALGSAVGYPLGAFGTAVGVADVARRLMTSPGWRTASAVTKARVADLLRAAQGTSQSAGAAATVTPSGHQRATTPPAPVQPPQPAPQQNLGARYLQQQMQAPAPSTVAAAPAVAPPPAAPPAAAPATVPAGMALPEAVMDIRKTVQVPQIDPTDVRFLIEEGVWPEDAPKYASVMRNAGFIDKAGYATPHFQEWVKKNLREVPFWADPRD